MYVVIGNKTSFFFLVVIIHFILDLGGYLLLIFPFFSIIKSQDLFSSLMQYYTEPKNVITEAISLVAIYLLFNKYYGQIKGGLDIIGKKMQRLW